MGFHTDNAGDVWLERLVDIKSCIATLDATQKTIVSQLASLEKVVMSVQEDMTWVRGDVRVMHEVVEKMADYVSMLNPTVAEVDGVPIQRASDVAAWGNWQVETSVEEDGLAEIPGMVQDDRVDLRDEEPSHIQVPISYDSAIAETQMFDINTHADGNMEDTDVAGGGEGWPQNFQGQFGLSPQSRKQPRRRDEEDAQDPAFDQMEMTFGGTQTETQAPGLSTWSEYTTAVRDMPSSVLGGGDRGPGSHALKCGRGSWTDPEARDTADTRADELSGHGSLNLNVTPPNVDGVEGMSGRGRNAAPTSMGPPSTGKGRGTGRGAGRGKGIPLVSPRYRSRVSLYAHTLLQGFLVIIAGLSKRAGWHRHGDSLIVETHIVAMVGRRNL